MHGLVFGIYFKLVHYWLRSPWVVICNGSLIEIVNTNVWYSFHVYNATITINTGNHRLANNRLVNKTVKMIIAVADNV